MCSKMGIECMGLHQGQRPIFPVKISTKNACPNDNSGSEFVIDINLISNVEFLIRFDIYAHPF
jgi:hypothetical protein